MKDEQALTSMKKFVEENFLKGNEDNVLEINITGNGFDIYKDEINTFIGKFLTKYVYHKQKHIKCIVAGIRLLKSIQTRSFFYSLPARNILDLNYIKPGMRHLKVSVTFLLLRGLHT